MKSSVTLYVPEGVDPFSSHTGKPARSKIRGFMHALQAVVGGGVYNRNALGSAGRPTAVVGTAYAVGTATAAAVQVGDTVTLNGQALTATSHTARSTVTIVIANTDVDDTVTINSVVFTAKAAQDTAARQFDISGTATAAATSLKACIDASSLAATLEVATAAGVVHLKYLTAGTAGNSGTMATSDADGLAIPGANFTGGAAVGNNEFDFHAQFNVRTATALAAAINASTTAIVSNNVKASNYAGTVTCASVEAGDTVEVGGVTFTAVAAASGLLGEWAMSGTDTQDAAALVVAINAHPAVKDNYFASSSSGVVTVRQRPFGLGTSTAGRLASSNVTRLAVVAITTTSTVHISAKAKGTEGNCMTIASSDATRLAIASATRLLGGTSTTLSF